MLVAEGFEVEIRNVNERGRHKGRHERIDDKSRQGSDDMYCVTDALLLFRKLGVPTTSRSLLNLAASNASNTAEFW